MSEDTIHYLPVVKPKQWYESRTIWFNAGTMIAGSLPFILSVIGWLEQILSAIDLSMVPERVAIIVGGVLSILSGLGIILRLDTNAPILMAGRLKE